MDDFLMTDNVVKFKPRKKVTEGIVDEGNWDLHDAILDFMEDNFNEGGIAITVDNGDVQVATALNNNEIAEEVLLVALEVIRSRL
jgi:hypothetical protein